MLLVNDGYPANFVPGSASVADEIVEMILAEIIVLLLTLMRSEVPAGIHRISLGQENAIRQIGRSADGWVPTFWPYRHFADGLAWVAEGAREAGRDPSSIELAPFVAVVPVDAGQARLADEGQRRFGIGRAAPPAVLNFGDLFTYALARHLDAPVLFKGDDFSRTDLRPAFNP